MNLDAQIPQALYQELSTLAEQENMSVEQLVHIALSAEVSVLEQRISQDTLAKLFQFSVKMSSVKSDHSQE